MVASAPSASPPRSCALLGPALPADCGEIITTAANRHSGARPWGAVSGKTCGSDARSTGVACHQARSGWRSRIGSGMMARGPARRAMFAAIGEWAPDGPHGAEKCGLQALHPLRSGARAASTSALEGVRKEASAGSRTTIDVLNAQQDLMAARARLIQAQRDRGNSEAGR